MKIENRFVWNYPTEQMVNRQRQYLSLDRQGVLKECVYKRYREEIENPFSLIRLLYNNWETFGKQLFLDYTGIIVDKDKITVTDYIPIQEMQVLKYKYIMWRCSYCGEVFVTSLKVRIGNGCKCKGCGHKMNNYNNKKDYFSN